MSERDFSAGGREFKLNKIDAFKQFHIVRRLGPILGDIIPVAQKIQALQKKKKLSESAEEKMTEEQMFEHIALLAGPIMTGISKLSDEDADFVLLGLCSAVEMQQAAGGWARVAIGSNLMFQDLELPVLLSVAGRAFAYNVAGFFALAPQVSHGGK